MHAQALVNSATLLPKREPACWAVGTHAILLINWETVLHDFIEIHCLTQLCTQSSYTFRNLKGSSLYLAFTHCKKHILNFTLNAVNIAMSEISTCFKRFCGYDSSGDCLKRCATTIRPVYKHHGEIAIRSHKLLLRYFTISFLQCKQPSSCI